MYNSSYTLKKITDLYIGGFELEANELCQSLSAEMRVDSILGGQCLEFFDESIVLILISLEKQGRSAIIFPSAHTFGEENGAVEVSPHL